VEWGLRYALTPKKQMLENHRRYMAAIVSEARKPYWNRGRAPEPPDDPLNRLVLPTFSNTVFSWDRTKASSRLVQGKLAARAFFLRHGRIPREMEDVAPEIVPKAPLDWFGEKPLRIGPLEGGGRPAVYSVGPDMDDDKGRSLGQQVLQTSDGDLVVVRRRQRLAPKNAPLKAPLAGDP
jgi:hypothetical protein